MQERVSFTRTARKHRIGRVHALFVMDNYEATLVPAEGGEVDDRYLWVGQDDRGLELEIIAVIIPGEPLLVIHVMPTALRRH
jgi:hypothetical protein